MAAWWAQIAGFAGALHQALARGDDSPTPDVMPCGPEAGPLGRALEAEAAHIPAKGAVDLSVEEVAAWRLWLRAAPHWSLEAAAAAARATKAVARKAQRQPGRTP